MNGKKIFALFLLVFLLSPTHCFAALAKTGSVFLSAEAGSWVGGGIGADNVLWTHGDQGIFLAERNHDQGIHVVFDAGRRWSFNFAAPTYDPVTNTNNGNELEVGFYDWATRFPFNSPTRPGMNFSGNGRGNNTLGGWFNVLDVQYGTGIEILSFAVDFRQFDESEGKTGPSTFGSLRINSPIPITHTPVPSSGLLLLSGFLILGRKKP